MSFATCLIMAGVGLYLLYGLRSHAVVSTGLSVAGLRGEFFERFEAQPSYFQDLSTRIASTTQRETYGFLGSVPQMRAWGTGRLAKGIRAESYSVENGLYEATIAVNRREIEDDQTGQIRLRVQELAEVAKVHKDYLIEQLLINGESTGFNSYDGVSFFNAAHVSGDSGSQNNTLTYNAGDADNPTEAEFRAALAQAIARMIGFKDDAGMPKRLAPTGLVCVVPGTMYICALNAINAKLVGTGTNPLQSNVLENACRVITLPGLTDASKFYILKTDTSTRPFIFQDRMPVEFSAVAEGSEEEFRREEYLYGVRARYAITYGYWQLALVTDFT